MHIFLNGRPRETAGEATLASLLEEAGIRAENVAVAVNNSVVPRSRIPSTRLCEGDRIEVITAAGGG